MCRVRKTYLFLEPTISQDYDCVLCFDARYGPREGTRREEFSMKGQLSCELKYAAFSRRKRVNHIQDSEEKDLSVLLREALEPAVQLVSK